MSLTGGKRKVNKSLKAWVAFVKKVQKEEKLSYKDAIHRAKQRKDKGEKWMTGGGEMTMGQDVGDGMMTTTPTSTPMAGGRRRHKRGGADEGEEFMGEEISEPGFVEKEEEEVPLAGGKRRTRRRSHGRGRGRTARRSRGRASRRH